MGGRAAWVPLTVASVSPLYPVCEQEAKRGFTNELLDVDRLVQHSCGAGPRGAHCSHTQEELVSQGQVSNRLLGHHHGPGIYRHPF